MAERRPDDAHASASLDGRLDLDALDAGHDPYLDLDVIGEDRPTFRESLARRLEPTGLPALAARHRTALTAAVVVAALVVAAGTVWWVRRPAPLPAPHVFARAAGADPTASLVQDPTTGVYTGVQQQLLLSSAEPPGVALAVLGITGPGLAPDPAGPAVAVDLARSDRPMDIASQISCTTPESTTAALASGPSDYTLLLQRTAPEGEVRVDHVPLVGSVTLVDLVHRACLQTAVDRDLLVTGITATPVAGNVAVDLDIALDNPSPRSWTGVHVAAAAMPVVMNDGKQVQLEPGTSGHLHAAFWPADCADPAGALRDGISLEADLGPDGRPPADSVSTPSVLLRLPGAMVDDVARVATSVCGTAVPRGTVTWARLREGGGNGSGGVIDFGVSLTAPGAGLVEVDHLGDGGPTVGELFAYESPVHTVDGVATIKAQWRLPTCQAILRDGLPRLHVLLVSDLRRPFLVPLSGDPLRPVLFRLCGNEVADLLR